jgi:hypothetical protein
MSLIASGKNFLAESLNTISPMQNNTETLKNLTQLTIMDELTSLAEDSPANRLALQEKEKEQRMNATCGKRCLELSESVNPVGSWARTFAGFVLGRTDWFSKSVTLTWKILGTPSNRLLFQLVPRTLPTDATEFGLLLTPTTSEPVHDLERFKARMEKYPNGTTMPNLATQVHGMLPTPNAFDWNTPRSPKAWKNAKEKHGSTLQNPLKQMASVGMLPTPTTKNVTGGAVQVNEKGKRQNKGGTEFSAQLHDLAKSGMLPTPTAQQERANASIDRGKGNLSDEVATRFQVGGKSSQLSPLFVEEMMGFPKNWTALPFQSGEEKQSKDAETQ